MKKIIVSFLLLSAMIVVAQNDTSQLQSLELSDSTAFGTPDGKSVSKEIGGAGGTIISEDGRIELIFPLGALTANRTISIQPTTNLSPNGTGKAYQLEPSGIQFKKPVQIIFRYTDEEAEECPPDLMGLAMQDHTGKWGFIEYEEWDSTGKILSGFIQHFSGLSNVNKLQLRLTEEEIIVNGKVSVDIVDISRKWGSAMAGLSLEGQYAYGKIDINAPVLWYVNGIQNGNSSMGSVTPYADPTWKGNAKHIFAIFTAPENLPKKNPATITADVFVFSGKTKVFLRARSLKCKINIYDEYEIKITAVWDNTNIRPKLGTTKWVDSSGFDLKLGAKSEISNIKNSLFQLEEEHFTPTCQFTFSNSNSCIGLIHISGMKGVGISYGSGSVYAAATIDFEQRQKIVMPIINITSCKGRGVPPQPQSTMLNALFAFPNRLKFELKDVEQKIEINDHPLSQLGKIEIIVRRKAPSAGN